MLIAVLFCSFNFLFIRLLNAASIARNISYKLADHNYNAIKQRD